MIETIWPPTYGDQSRQLVDCARQRPQLSDRERQVLVQWLGTDSKDHVGRTLFITVNTVNTHLRRVREKYAAAGRPASTKASLVARAIQDGLINLEDL